MLFKKESKGYFENYNGQPICHRLMKCHNGIIGFEIQGHPAGVVETPFAILATEM
jgi:hypothetical protein